MALGKRGDVQGDFWVSAEDLPKSPGHPFYQKLNGLLAEVGFDDWVESRCQQYYADNVGRPGIPPGTYFRMLLIGYFEGITSQRGIAWRCSDSLSLRSFLGLATDEDSPEHSSLTRVRKRLPLEVHQEVFEFVLGMASEKKMLDGKTVAVDSTTLEANAAMKSIVRRDTGEDYKAYLQRLAEAEGIEDPTDEVLRRFDKKRKGKKTSNKEWKSSTDSDSRVTKMKDGRTHLAYKAENTMDLGSDLLLSAEVYYADYGDTDSGVLSVIAAQKNLLDAGIDVEIQETVADKGYHSAKTLRAFDRAGLRTYIPEPQQKHRRRWTDKADDLQRAVYANRRRVRGNRSKRLQKLRSELVERSFAHMCETGGGRRTWLRGLKAVRKRYAIQGAARNLGVMLRKLFGVGTPRGLQRGLDGLFGQLLTACRLLMAVTSSLRRTRLSTPSSACAIVGLAVA